MSITTKLTPWLAATGMLLVTAFASSSVYATGSYGPPYDLPGIPASGSPAIINDVKVKFKKHTQAFNITGKRDFKLLTGGTTYAGYKLKYTLNYDLDTSFGSLEIKGKIPGLGITDRKTVLVTADVIDFASGSTGHHYGHKNNLLGFATDNIVCDPVLDAAVGCTVAESVYVKLTRGWGGESMNANLRGTAITTIPLPAAVWLFGSGLAFLGATVRRRRKTA